MNKKRLIAIISGMMMMTTPCHVCANAETEDFMPEILMTEWAEKESAKPEFPVYVSLEMGVQGMAVDSEITLWGASYNGHQAYLIDSNNDVWIFNPMCRSYTFIEEEIPSEDANIQQTDEETFSESEDTNLETPGDALLKMIRVYKNTGILSEDALNFFNQEFNTTDWIKI